MPNLQWSWGLEYICDIAVRSKAEHHPTVGVIFLHC